MIEKSKLKKSELKQYNGAWDNFYRRMKELIEAVIELQNIPDTTFTVDDLNQISNRVEKFTKTLTRIRETIIK